MKRIIIVALCLFTIPPAFAGQIALSFDDAPRRITPYFNKNERGERLLAALRKAKVDQVIFFSTTTGLKDPKRKARLMSYAEAGHLIANHTHSHKRPDKMGVGKYIDDIKSADRQLKSFKNFVRVFRYPFLDYGKSIASRDRIRAELKSLGYSNGYVTVDNADWYMDSVLQKAVRSKKRVNLENLRNTYVDAIWDSIAFYDDLAIKVLGRSPKHILLLHENDLAALFIKDLVDRIRSKGWEIISPMEAYQDPISSMIPDTLLNGNGRIAAIAHASGFEGKKRDCYQSEKKVDQLFADRKVFE